MILLAVNYGSATIKYKLFQQTKTGLAVLAHGAVELHSGYTHAIAELLKTLPQRPQRIVHRVVHGGTRFSGAVLIDATVRAAIAELAELAPLHNPLALEGIAACAQLGVPMVAVFDTGFHRTLPTVARTYGLPPALTGKLHIQRYGFHGISHQYVSAQYGRLVGAARPSLITLHLGNGCSAAAIREGVSVDTSMGFSPLEGLLMGTRAGDLDPNILLYLLNHGWTPARLEHLLNHEAGLLGLAGTHDMRELLQREDEAAQLAVQIFVQRIRKYVGSYLAVLAGTAQAVVFTGGIGEHAAAIRAQIGADFGWAGLRIDAALNAAADGSAATRISSAGSTLQAWVIPTDEERQMAELALGISARDEEDGSRKATQTD